jgi:drug/metabolite transporter (DMT)-like permease
MATTDRYTAAGGQAGVAFMAGSTVVLWASVFPLTRYCLKWFGPLDLVTLRMTITAAALAAALAFARVRLPSLRQFAMLALCALFGVALYNLFLSWGLVTLSAGAASFLTNTIPIFASLLSFLLNAERPGWRTVCGMLVAFVGIIVLALGEPGGISFGSGTMLVLAGAICSAIYIVLQRRLVHAFMPFEAASWLMILGAVFLLPYSVGAVRAAAGAPLHAVLVVFVLALVPGTLGQITWLRVLKAIPAGKAATLLFLIPPIATAIGMIFLDETVSASMLAGGIIALAGVAMVHGRGERSPGG